MTEARFEFNLSEGQLEQLALEAVRDQIRALGACPEHGEHGEYEWTPERQGIVACCETWLGHVLEQIGAEER
jgi:hypothetical protein